MEKVIIQVSEVFFAKIDLIDICLKINYFAEEPLDSEVRGLKIPAKRISVML